MRTGRSGSPVKIIRITSHALLVLHRKAGAGEVLDVWFLQLEMSAIGLRPRRRGE